MQEGDLGKDETETVESFTAELREAVIGKVCGDQVLVVALQSHFLDPE